MPDVCHLHHADLASQVQQHEVKASTGSLVVARPSGAPAILKLCLCRLGDRYRESKCDAGVMIQTDACNEAEQ